MGAWGPPIPFARPFLYQPGDRLADLMLQAGRDRAAAAQHQGDIWGSALAGVGQNIAQAITAQHEENQRKQLGTAIAAGTTPPAEPQGPPEESGAAPKQPAPKVDRAAILKTLPPELVPQAQAAFQAFDDHAALAAERQQQAALSAAKARQDADAARQAQLDAVGALAAHTKPFLSGPDGGLRAMLTAHSLAKEKGFPGADQFDQPLVQAMQAMQQAEQSGDTQAVAGIADQVRKTFGPQLDQFMLGMSPSAREALTKETAKGVVVPEGGTLLNSETGEVMGKGAEKAARVTPGSFEDFAVRKFGPSPTPQQLIQARAEWAAAGKEPESDNAVSLTGPALKQAAVRYLIDGTLPPMGMGKTGAKAREAILNAAAEMDPDANIARNKAGFLSNEGSLKKLQQQTDAVSAFENTANKNAAILDDVLKKIPDTGVRFLNRPWRALQGQLGSEDMAKFEAIRQSVQNEYGRILSNPNLSGTMSDNARKEAETLLSGSATAGQMRAALSTLAAEAKNRRESYQGQIDEINGRMSGGKPKPEAPAAVAGPKKIASDAEYAALPSGAEFIAPDGSHRRKP